MRNFRIQNRQALVSAFGDEACNAILSVSRDSFLYEAQLRRQYLDAWGMTHDDLTFRYMR